MAQTPVINAQLDTANAELVKIVEGFARQNLLLSQMITSSDQATSATVLNEIHEIVRSGEAANVFSIGDQINVAYNDGTSNYVLPFDIVHFDNVVLQDGETVPGMYIQSHYAMQGVQFDAREAFYVVPSTGLGAGYYNFTVTSAWGSTATGTYMFQATSDLPGGALLVFDSDIYSGIVNTKVNVYASATATTASAQYTITSGNTGTSLGDLGNGAQGTLNNITCATYGYNRWSQSAIRQFLNSDSAANAWWTPKNSFDRAPSQLTTLPGFMAGFDAAFLNIIKPVKVTTALNTVSDSGIGTSENTYDTFFPASLEQEYIVPQLANTEGVYWEYWKRRLGLSSPQAQGSGGTNPAHIRYGYDARTTAQYCRLRSAYRGNAFNTWYVYTSGYAYNTNATYTIRCAPACVIC